MQLQTYNLGGMVGYPMSMTYSRWGAGAEPGKTHVWNAGEGTNDPGPFFLSEQCVVDDFGALIPVERSAASWLAGEKA